MHILMTGATGFVGQRLCKRLHDDGHQVTAVSRDVVTAQRRLGQVPAITWEDLEEGGIPEGIDGVIHLAGESVKGRWGAAKRRRVRESRIRTTRTVVGAIQRAEKPPEVFISASGIGFYGDRGEELLVESAEAGDDYFAELCVDWEAEAMLAAPRTRVVLSRLGIVLGLGGGAVEAMILPTSLGLGGPLGGGKQWWSWIHLDDVVGALMFMLTTESISGPVNVVAPESVRQKDFAVSLGRAMARPSLLPTPAFGLRLVLGDFAQEILSSKRVVPDVLQTAGFQYSYPDLDDALSHVMDKPAPAHTWMPVLAAGTLGLAPYTPEPHLTGKIRWLLGGATGMQPVDWLDLLMHASPWMWLAWALCLRLGTRWSLQ